LKLQLTYIDIAFPGRATKVMLTMFFHFHKNNNNNSNNKQMENEIWNENTRGVKHY